MRYGIPYKGSKSRIAEWVVGILPPSTCLVDLFAGGCAVTHVALLSGKWERVYANDTSDAPLVFMDAARGEFDGFSLVPSREQFREMDDDAVRLLYSFGNNRRDYIWSRELEPVKLQAERMLSAPSVHERRMHYRSFVRDLAGYIHSDGEGAEGKLVGSDGSHGLQGLQGLEGLERLQGLHVSQLDYRDVTVPDGATVYADPPTVGLARSSTAARSTSPRSTGGCKRARSRCT